ncbi:hypothetical protein N8Z47_01125 [Salibacteraceae bacterium]|nr:hypothetical protein [Salibacteraceae bacterium]
MTLQNRIYQIVYFLITTLIVVGPALYNRYPLVYFDSGAYMEMAASLEPSFHRAIGYPLLMKLSGWMISNWPIVILQGLMVTLLSFRLVQLLTIERQYWNHFLLVSVLSFSTSLSWYAAQLMPDIFTFLVALTTILIIVESKLSWKKMIGYSAILFVGLITHLSHIPMLLLVILSLLILKKVTKADVSRQKIGMLAAPLVLAFFFTCSYNAIWGYGFRMSMASNVFITANLGEMGILKMYLDENCPESSNALCEIKDKLPLETGGYLWDGDAPVNHISGGWEEMNDQCAPIVHDFLTKPRYLKWLVFASVKATFKQMFQIELGSGLQYTYADGSPPSWPMHSHFKQELNEYLVSVQNKDASQLPIDFFKMLNYISLFLSMLILGWAVLTKKLDEKLALVLVVAFAFYFFNAAITGVLANIYERLQTRLLPLFPMIAMLVLITKSTFFNQSTEAE